MVSTAYAANDIPENSLFRIGEVSRLTATKTFVLRFWESEFPMLQPVKSPSGHRLYRREDIETVLEIKRLLTTRASRSPGLEDISPSGEAVMARARDKREHRCRRHARVRGKNLPRVKSQPDTQIVDFYSIFEKSSALS